MDRGHYNCRDYHVSPHFAPVSSASTIRPMLHRDESYEELIERSRSPASFQPKFPLLRLPLELRQLILSFVLPRTTRLGTATAASVLGKLSDPKYTSEEGEQRHRASVRIRDDNHIAWLRGNINVMLTCSQLHRECAEMIYGTNTFLLVLNYTGINFRFRWMMPHGVVPSRNYPFLELMPKRYLNLIRRIIVHVDHVDSYTGMIKFNVGGRGLIHGLRKQVIRLVSALQATSEDDGDGDSTYTAKGLSRVVVRISSANEVIDSLNRRRAREAEAPELSERELMQRKLQAQDIQDVLEPFGDLMGVNETRILGAVTNDYARSLEAKMQSREPRLMHACCIGEGVLDKAMPILCVYGNDI